VGQLELLLAAAWLVSVTGFVDPHVPLGLWNSAMSFGWLGFIAWISIALGQPFTLGMPRLRVERDVWEQRGFREAQTVLTRMWAIVFTLIAVVLVACVSAHQGTMLTLTVRVVGLIIGAYLTSRHIKASRQHRMATAE